MSRKLFKKRKEIRMCIKKKERRIRFLEAFNKDLIAYLMAILFGISMFRFLIPYNLGEINETVTLLGLFFSVILIITLCYGLKKVAEGMIEKFEEEVKWHKDWLKKCLDDERFVRKYGSTRDLIDFYERKKEDKYVK